MVGLLKSIFCFFLPFSCSQNLKKEIIFKDCGSIGSISSVDITPCDWISPGLCSFKHGINATVTINFTPGMDANVLKTQVYGIVAGIPVPYVLPNPDACNGCNLNCPLTKGQNYTYKNTFPVKKEYPDIKLVVKWEIVDEKKQTLVCYTFPMQIQG